MLISYYDDDDGCDPEMDSIWFDSIGSDWIETLKLKLKHNQQ